MNNNKVNKEVEKTLSSLDELKRAEVKPFFYTRLTAKLENDTLRGASFKWQWAVAVVMMVMLLNGLVFSSLWPVSNEDQEIELLADEYGVDYVDLYSQDIEL